MSVICFINNGCRNTVTVETIVLILKIPISFLYLSNSFKKYKHLLFSIIFAIYFMLDGEKLWNYWSKSIKAFTSRKVDTVIHQ